MFRTIATFIAVSVGSLLLSGLWPSITYSVAMIAVDAAACAVITWHPAGKWQSVIGLSFVFQIMTHLAYIASMFFYERADIGVLYWGLSGIAIIQLALIGGWIGGGRLARYWRRSDPDPDIAPARFESLGQ